MQADKAGKEYWDTEWARGSLPAPVRIEGAAFATRVDRAFHQFFLRTFREKGLLRGRLLEIGCARSVWLPYFASEFGFDVDGLDYSELGCESSRVLLARAGVPGTVHHGDLFAAPADLGGRFDVAVSFGVMEHFAQTADAVKAAASLVKPGGLVCTLVPNLTGLIGLIQQNLDKSVYDIHVPLDREALAAAHRNAGLQVLDCRYLLLSNLSVLNSNRLRANRPVAWRLLMRVASVVDRMLYFAERFIPVIARPNAFTSPYVACVAAVPRTPAEAASHRNTSAPHESERARAEAPQSTRA